MGLTDELTGIGSLPFARVDDALAYAWAHDVPFLPQLPRGHPGEFMLPAALHGLSGLRVDERGGCTLERDSTFDCADLEPAERAWPAFIERVNATKPKRAKVQLAGPVTVTWFVQWAAAGPLAGDDDAVDAVARVLGRKAVVMLEALRRCGVSEPWLFIDEPGLDDRDSAFELLTAFVARVKAEAPFATLGVHCCGAPDWPRLLSLPELDVVSFDQEQSGAAVRRACTAFVARGGTLAVGLGPTTHLDRGFGDVPSRLLTAPCGLALTSDHDARMLLNHLRREAETARGWAG